LRKPEKFVSENYALKNPCPSVSIRGLTVWCEYLPLKCFCVPPPQLVYLLIKSFEINGTESKR
jgi:hypothetical protein